MSDLIKRSSRKSPKTANQNSTSQFRLLTGVRGGAGNEPVFSAEQEELTTTAFIGIGGVKKPPP